MPSTARHLLKAALIPLLWLLVPTPAAAKSFEPPAFRLGQPLDAFVDEAQARGYSPTGLDTGLDEIPRADWPSRQRILFFAPDDRNDEPSVTVCGGVVVAVYTGRSGTIHDVTALAALAEATHGPAAATVNRWQEDRGAGSVFRLAWTDAPSGTRYEIVTSIIGGTTTYQELWSLVPDRCPDDE